MIKLLILHYIGDFLLQTRQMATEKSEQYRMLLLHCFIYTVVLLFGLSLKYAVLCGISHVIIDWNVWRFYKSGKPSYFRYWEDKWFYNTIGFDQMLHVIILVLLWRLK